MLKQFLKFWGELELYLGLIYTHKWQNEWYTNGDTPLIKFYVKYNNIYECVMCTSKSHFGIELACFTKMAINQKKIVFVDCVLRV